MKGHCQDKAIVAEISTRGYSRTKAGRSSSTSNSRCNNSSSKCSSNKCNTEVELKIS